MHNILFTTGCECLAYFADQYKFQSKQHLSPVAKMASKRMPASCDTPPSKKAKLFANSPNRNFKDTWKIGHSWLNYDAKQKLMFCDVCIGVQKANSFTAGCSVFKKESVTKHAVSKGM